ISAPNWAAIIWCTLDRPMVDVVGPVLDEPIQADAYKSGVGGGDDGCVLRSHLRHWRGGAGEHGAAPHRRHRVSSVGSRKRTHVPESKRFITAIIGRVARLEICGTIDDVQAP